MSKYYLSNGKPIKCFKCGSNKIHRETVATDNGYESERSYECDSCGAELGYWDHGHYDHSYMMDALE